MLSVQAGLFLISKIVLCLACLLGLMPRVVSISPVVGDMVECLVWMGRGKGRGKIDSSS